MYDVLIVEDDPMVAMINEQYVSRNKKFRVAGSVRDGRAALNFFEEHMADLVIMDIYMPHMDGLELLHKMREQGFVAKRRGNCLGDRALKCYRAQIYEPSFKNGRGFRRYKL